MENRSSFPLCHTNQSPHPIPHHPKKTKKKEEKKGLKLQGGQRDTEMAADAKMEMV